MTTYSRWFKILFSGGIGLMALALLISVLTPFVFNIAGPWGFGSAGIPGGMMGSGAIGPGMMSGMMGGGMMGGGGFGPFSASSGFGGLNWLLALPSLLFPLGLLMLVGAGGVWLAQTPVPTAQGDSGPIPSKQCLHCGQPAQSNWRHCPHCGATLS